MTELATLAPEVEASLSTLVEDPQAAGSEVRAALADVAAELRAEGAPWLDALAEELEQPLAWQAVDRTIHGLVHDVVVSAVRGEDDDDRAARLVALRTIARHDALWPGASARYGCAFDYGALLATVRMTALDA